MQSEAMAGRVSVEGALRKAKLVAVGLALAAVGALMMADDATASSTYGYADSDGYVPVYSDCWPGDEVGVYNSYYDGYAVYGTVYINDCALARLGAGPRDRQYVVAHELGHSRGLPDNYNPNSYMYYGFAVTGT